MDQDQLSEVLSSKVKLRIESALAVRPRTLGELASFTGITVQGVLRHLKRLQEVGLVEERKVPATASKARRVYAAKSSALGDFSAGSLVVVKGTEKWPSEGEGRRMAGDVERMAGEILLQRRRVRDAARRLGRMIDELSDEQEALAASLDLMPLSAEERLVLEVILTEETLEEGVTVLSRYYGIEDRRSIDKALAKARQSVHQ